MIAFLSSHPSNTTNNQQRHKQYITTNQQSDMFSHNSDGDGDGDGDSFFDDDSFLSESDLRGVNSPTMSDEDDLDWARAENAMRKYDRRDIDVDPKVDCPPLPVPVLMRAPPPVAPQLSSIDEDVYRLRAFMAAMDARVSALARGNAGAGDRLAAEALKHTAEISARGSDVAIQELFQESAARGNAQSFLLLLCANPDKFSLEKRAAGAKIATENGHLREADLLIRAARGESVFNLRDQEDAFGDP